MDFGTKQPWTSPELRSRSDESATRPAKSTEAELEHRLDALLDTEGIDPDDEAAIEDAIDRLDTVADGPGSDTELVRN